MVQHFILQRAIEQEINRPNFTASLPPLSDKTWIKILNYGTETRAENERLEFVGDALMYATLGRQMYTQLPNGTPHLYTVRPLSMPCCMYGRIILGFCAVCSCGAAFERHVLSPR